MKERTTKILNKFKRITLRLDLETYLRCSELSHVTKIPLAKLCRLIIKQYFEHLFHTAEVEGSIPSRSILFKINFNDICNYFSSLSITEKTKKDRILALKSEHLFEINSKHELLSKLINIGKRKNLPDYKVKAIRLFLKYLVDKSILTIGEYNKYTKLFKYKKYIPDTHVPKDNEIYESLKRSKEAYLKSYLILLCSGIRVVELDYLKNNLHKAEKYENFVRIELKKIRRTKRVEYVYLPSFLYELIKDGKFKGSNALKCYSKRWLLIPPKYYRKWFYTKIINLGVPFQIADFYQGRIPSSIGLRHYYNALEKADEEYSKKVVPFLVEFIKNFLNQIAEYKKKKFFSIFKIN
ncbi:MAG: integrase [Candidatus Woesearchaeota archaeon]